MYSKGSMFKVSQRGNHWVDSPLHLSRKKAVGDRKKDLNKIVSLVIQVSLRRRMTKKEKVSWTQIFNSWSRTQLYNQPERGELVLDVAPAEQIKLERKTSSTTRSPATNKKDNAFRVANPNVEAAPVAEQWQYFRAT